MKNSTRFNNVKSDKYLINLKLQRLQEFLRDEINFGVPCYDEGTLSPKPGLEEIFRQVLELDDLFNKRESDIRVAPPATPEALIDLDDFDHDQINEAIE